MNDLVSPPAQNIPDLAAGVAYLGRIPLANPAVAERQFGQFLDSLLAQPPEHDDLFVLLEQARVPLCFVEEEMARRYHNKPLILGEVEEDAFEDVVAAWRKMGKAYELCARLATPDPEDPQYAVRVATILHRCLYYTGMIILEHFRARRELPQGIWLDLHGYFATAEEWGVATAPVQDALEHERQTTHCTAAYVTLLLIELASPYARSVRDLNLIRRWAGQWAPLVAVQPLGDEAEVPPYVLQLMRDGGLHPAANSEDFGNDVRRLDTTRLGLQMNQMLMQLSQRIPPSQLGLGEETSSHVTRLLQQLSRTWTQQTAPRRFRRFPTQGSAKVVLGLEGIHYFLNGEREFIQHDSAKTYSRGDFDTLFTFRFQENTGRKLTIREAPDFHVDTWGMTNHSANGFRLVRTAAGQKISHGELMAICPEDGDRYLLGQATWLMQSSDGGIVAGVAVLPGVPVAVGVRLSGVGVGHQFVRAFLLPAIPAISETANVVMAPGMYSGSRVLDVQAAEGTWQIRLKTVLQRGLDFERIGFDLV